MLQTTGRAPDSVVGFSFGKAMVTARLWNLDRVPSDLLWKKL